MQPQIGFCFIGPPLRPCMHNMAKEYDHLASSHTDWLRQLGVGAPDYAPQHFACLWDVVVPRGVSWIAVRDLRLHCKVTLLPDVQLAVMRAGDEE